MVMVLGMIVSSLARAYPLADDLFLLGSPLAGLGFLRQRKKLPD